MSGERGNGRGVGMVGEPLGEVEGALLVLFYAFSSLLASIYMLLSAP